MPPTDLKANGDFIGTGDPTKEGDSDCDLLKGA